MHAEHWKSLQYDGLDERDQLGFHCQQIDTAFWRMNNDIPLLDHETQLKCLQHNLFPHKKSVHGAPLMLGPVSRPP